MTRDIVLIALEAIAVISAIGAMFSLLFFREGGIIWGTITPKAIKVSAICLGTLMLSGVAGISIYDPSKTLTVTICMGGISVIFGVYFIILYESVPHLAEKNRWLQRERRKLLGLKDEDVIDSHKTKDSNDSDPSQG
jgi:hypothetical protein